MVEIVIIKYVLWLSLIQIMLQAYPVMFCIDGGITFLACLSQLTSQRVCGGPQSNWPH